MRRGPPVVDLADVRAKLDRLAELARMGVDVLGMLDWMEQEDEVGRDDEAGWTGSRRGAIPRSGRDGAVNVSLRLNGAMLAEADELAEALVGSPEAQVAGGHWGRSAVLRLATAEGLRVLRKRARGDEP